MTKDISDELNEEIIELVGDGGDVLKFTHIGTINYKDEKFVFFLPLSEDETDEVVVFKIGESDGEEVLLPVDDEKLLQEVFEEFVKIYDEED